MTQFSSRVESIVLCNSFASTKPFQQSTKWFSVMPEFALKKHLLDSFPRTSLFPHAVDFMVDQVEALSRQELLGRLMLNQ